LRQEVDAKQRTRRRDGAEDRAFSTVKTLDDFDFKIPALGRSAPRARMATARFLCAGRNVLIFGALLGKTHLASALGARSSKLATRPLYERHRASGGPVQAETDGQLSDRLMLHEAKLLIIDRARLPTFETRRSAHLFSSSSPAGTNAAAC